MMMLKKRSNCPIEELTSIKIENLRVLKGDRSKKIFNSLEVENMFVPSSLSTEE